MGKTLSILVSLAVTAAAYAEVEVRIWVTTESPAKADGGPINFAPGYGPFTPFTVQSNDYGPHDVHRRYVSASDPSSVLSYEPGTPYIEKFSPEQIPDVVEPGVGDAPDLEAGTPVYIWAAFCGPGDVDPIKPLLGWETPDVRVQGINLKLVTTGSLVLDPHWYQYEHSTWGHRWAVASDMSGDEVTLIGLVAPAFGWYAGAVSERMQTWALDSVYGGGDAYGAGGILLGAIRYVGGAGDLYVGLGHNGMSCTDETGAIFLPGTENVGIVANKIPDGSPPRIGQTPEATWIPEPASLSLLGLTALALRRRCPRAGSARIA
jgi:hypothetical protein